MIETHTDRKITLQISKDTLKNSAIYGTIILHKQNIKKQRAEGMGKVVVGTWNNICSTHYQYVGLVGLELTIITIMPK